MADLLALETPPFSYPHGDFANAFPLFEEVAAVQRETHGRWTLCDAAGDPIGEGTYARGGPVSEGILIIREEAGWGAVEITGRVVLEPKLQDIDVFSEGLVPAKLKGKWGYADRNGHWVIAPSFQDALPMCEGVAPVKVKKDWGYVDQSGHFVIEPMFKRAFCFSKGRAQVVSGGSELRSKVLREYKKDAAAKEFKGKWGIIDPEGKYLVKPRFDYQESEFGGVGTEEDASLTMHPFHMVKRRVHGAARFTHGVAPFRHKSRWGYCDENGEIVIEPQYGWAKPFDPKGIAKAYRWIDEATWTGEVVELTLPAR